MNQKRSEKLNPSNAHSSMTMSSNIMDVPCELPFEQRRNVELFGSVPIINSIPSIRHMKKKLDASQNIPSEPFNVFKSRHTAFFPRKATSSALWDLMSCETVTLPPFGTTSVPLGLIFNFPTGFFGQICNRSSISFCNIIVGGGIIDEDYTGEVSVILHNLNNRPTILNPGEKIAQLMLCKNYNSEIKMVPRGDILASKNSVPHQNDMMIKHATNQQSLNQIYPHQAPVDMNNYPAYGQHQQIPPTSSTAFHQMDWESTFPNPPNYQSSVPFGQHYEDYANYFFPSGQSTGHQHQEQKNTFPERGSRGFGSSGLY